MGNKKESTVDKVLKIFNNDWNKQVILYGPPGTSKTYSATEIAARFLAGKTEKSNPLEGDPKSFHERCEKYLAENPNYKVIQFHPSYSYEDFVRGIVVKTEVSENGEIKKLATPTYEVERKIIETFGEDASEKNPKVLVIDEINRAPLGSVLGELIYGLEYRGKPVSTPYVFKDKNGEKPLKISEHLYIIGTMNTADRSIGTMDYAVRRRFAFVPVLPCIEVIESSWSNPSVGEKARSLFETLMGTTEDEDGKIVEAGIFSADLLEDSELNVNDIKIGHTYFLGKKEIAQEKEMDYFKYRIDYQIRPVYEEYIKDGLIRKSGLEKFNNLVKKVMEEENKA